MREGGRGRARNFTATSTEMASQPAVRELTGAIVEEMGMLSV